MKEWEIVQVNSYKNVIRKIKEHQENGWNLHTYQCMMGYHYLLFEKGE